MDQDLSDEGFEGMDDDEQEDDMGMDKLGKVAKVKEAKAEKGGKEKVIKDPAAKKKKKSKNKRDLKFDTFIHRVLKQVHPNIGITKQGMNVMNDLVCNAFFQISEEAGKLVKMGNRDTLSARDINCAVRLILPGELAQHSNDEGQSALKHFEQSTRAKNDQ